MADLKEYEELVALQDRARREADKAQGRADQLLSELKREYGCRTLAEAEQRLAEMAEEERRLERAYVKELKAFKALYGDKLGDPTDAE